MIRVIRVLYPEILINGLYDEYLLLFDDFGLGRKGGASMGGIRWIGEIGLMD
jgi:hypothetical protein